MWSIWALQEVTSQQCISGQHISDTKGKSERFNVGCSRLSCRKFLRQSTCKVPDITPRQGDAATDEPGRRRHCQQFEGVVCRLAWRRCRRGWWGRGKSSACAWFQVTETCPVKMKVKVGPRKSRLTILTALPQDAFCHLSDSWIKPIYTWVICSLLLQFGQFLLH